MRYRLDGLVMTTSGPKNISSITPYVDELIEYKTNRSLKVLNIKCEELKIFKITYANGIEQIVPSKYPIHNKKYVVPLYPVQFNKSIKKLEPDPYVVGGLLTYGDFNDIYMNLPEVNNKFNTYLLNKYYIQEAGIDHKDKIYYRHTLNDFYDEYVTWKEFLGDLKSKLIHKNMNYPDIFPNEYIYSDIRDRYHLLSGAFDLGYDREFFDNRTGIKCKNKHRIKAIQYILRSIGIPSEISYYNGLYILYLTDEDFDNSRIGYDIENMLHQLSNKDLNNPRITELDNVTNVEYIDNRMTFVPVIEEEDVLYLDQLFLPVRSI